MNHDHECNHFSFPFHPTRQFHPWINWLWDLYHPRLRAKLKLWNTNRSLIITITLSHRVPRCLRWLLCRGWNRRWKLWLKPVMWRWRLFRQLFYWDSNRYWRGIRHPRPPRPRLQRQPVRQRVRLGGENIMCLKIFEGLSAKIRIQLWEKI